MPYGLYRHISNVFQLIRKSPKAVKLLLVEQFMEGFIPIMALYAIMFSSAGHLNLQQIGLLFSIWGLAYVVAELPTGILADVWSRKNMIIVGGILRGVGFAIWIVWPTFMGYAIGFALWGLMIACASGTVAAYLHSELDAEGESAAFSKYFGWIMSANSIGMLVAYIVAAVLTLRHVDALIALSVLSSFSIALLAFAPEHAYAHTSTYMQTLRNSVNQVRSNSKLRYVCFVLFSIFMIIGVLEELLPRVYASFSLNNTWVSMLGAIALLLTALLLTRLEAMVHFSFVKQLLLMATGILLLLGGLMWGVAAASVLVLLFNLIFHLYRPIYMHYVQAVATGHERATINSIPGLAGGLLGAIAYAIIGRIAQVTNQNFGIGVYAVFWLLVLLLLIVVGKRYDIPKEKSPVVIDAIESPQTIG